MADNDPGMSYATRDQIAATFMKREDHQKFEVTHIAAFCICWTPEWTDAPATSCDVLKRVEASQLKFFPDTYHGFAIRGDPKASTECDPRFYGEMISPFLCCRHAWLMSD